MNLNLANIIISDAESATVPYTLTNATVLIDTAPVLTQIGAKSVDEGSALAFTVSASDADGDSLTYSATNLPAGASFNTEQVHSRGRLPTARLIPMWSHLKSRMDTSAMRLFIIFWPHLLISSVNRGYCMRNLRSFSVRYNSNQKILKSLSAIPKLSRSL